MIIGNTSLRAGFGGGPKTVEVPSYSPPSANISKEEKERIKQYEAEMVPFGDIYKQQLDPLEGYTEDIAGLYPQRRQRATSLEGDIFDMLPQSNLLSPEFQQQAQERYDIRKQRGMETFKEMYDPLDRKITGRAMQQFGGLDNTAYQGLQGRLSDERAEGLSEFVNQLELQRQMEEQQQLAMQQGNLQNLMQAQGLYGTLTQEYPAALGSLMETGKGGLTLYSDLINAMKQRGIQGAAMQNQFNLANFQNNLQALQYAQQQRNSWMQPVGMGMSLLGGLM